ncbi:hypothetical protein ABGT18_26440 [Pseudomonas putida]|nr:MULTISPECIES: hypothetical protein [Pseudomonas]EKT4457987.1 hypothetical protein [Pseudomonas putida]EKT4473367.1 hypothetical protein [Pseudomonas putida]EKT4496541.1 hypothetical protein [Pseudomonas putida]EKT4514654.1 hypothetical protein [Pseudomonas putida]EKT4531329.1 hypothetical protein [Pseudomonas putida]
MNTESAPLQSGVIMVTDPDQAFNELIIPEKYGETFTLNITLSKPRKIQFADIPSASVITLTGNDWSLKLKTTHHPAGLEPNDIYYYARTYDNNAFIKEGMGVVVMGKTGTASNDTLKKIEVTLSKKPGLPSTSRE